MDYHADLAIIAHHLYMIKWMLLVLIVMRAL
jgi:hypothetical protein